MSKRFMFPQQNGERKKAKLDVTISDHNFPLSQNAGPSNETDKGDTWGDDNDDEILLLASQACEDAYSDISMLPNYSICMQPSTTSTQLSEPEPSTSKTNFAFKRPSAIPTNVTTNNLKEKCNRISSPLPGIMSKMMPNINNQANNVSDDLIFNDKICKGQDSEQVYRQLLQLQEENAKLKSENGKLLEKCVTKEGEASILRTQLKTCQVAVDNARMERIKAQEKVQMEWTEKLTAANNQMHDLRTQLDFKNLEIISIKERCRMLESSKIKLTQVTVSNNDISSSHKNNSIIVPNDVHTRKTKMTSNAVQTETKAHFLRLNKTLRSEPSKLTTLLPIILEPTPDQHSLLEYNEKLQSHTDLSQNKCRIFSTFHRVPSTPVPKEIGRVKVTISSLYEDLTSVAAGAESNRCYGNILNSVRAVLNEVANQLEVVSQKTTTAFQREMDEKYIEATSSFTVVSEKDLLSGRTLYKEEQSILARRLTALLACILDSSTDVYAYLEDQRGCIAKILDVINRICSLLESTSCTLLYSGLLLAITYLIRNLMRIQYVMDWSSFHTRTINIIKSVIKSRPMSFVSCEVLELVIMWSTLMESPHFTKNFCAMGPLGNLKMDYDQGVLLYKKDSCSIQILLKQIEVSLRCIEKQNLLEQAASTTQNLIIFHKNFGWEHVIDNNKKKSGEEVGWCNCQLVLIQVIVYALRICAVMLKNSPSAKDDLLPTCLNGILVLYQCIIRDVELSSHLSHNEGHLVEFCELMKDWVQGEVHGNMLTELSGTFQSSPEDMTSSFHRQAWLKSFETFSMAD